MTDRLTLDQMTSNDLDALYDDRDRHARLRSRVQAAAEEARGGIRDWLIDALADSADPREPSTARTFREQAARAEAAIARVRAIHQPTEGLGYDSDEDDTPGSYGDIAQACTTCGTSGEYGIRWPCPTIRALDEPTPVSGPAATEPVVDRQTAVVLSALHHSAETDVSRVISLYERWVKAGPPPIGTSMARWWDERLVELRAAILNPSPAAPVVLRDPCPRCEDCRFVPRALMADHNREHHPEEQQS
jgi:hypothetical protein